MDRHIVLVGALHIGLSIVGMFFLVLVAAALMSSHRFYQIDPDGARILSVVLPVITGFVILKFFGSIIGGIGLLMHRSWARILTLIVSAMDLLSVPFGTALAIYSFWVLLQPQTVELLSPVRST